MELAMVRDPNEAIEKQRRYYAETAESYDTSHDCSHDEHYMSLSVMNGLLDFLGVTSVLDIGSGTGRSLRFLNDRRPKLRTMGVEPVAELREIAYSHGIEPDQLVDGDVMSLAFGHGEFDIVCSFGVLHHVPDPARAVEEMLRVAKKAVFISDSNNFGQGHAAVRFIKQTLNRFRLWPMVDLIRTKGQGYHVSEGDGVYYSYSVFNQLDLLRRYCGRIHQFNTVDASPDLYRTAGHVAILGVKG
ncbi:MAG: class I SAM-dependent methyltransferase [Myxococcota bacterium]